jgi:hypothetical protein
VRFPLPCFFRHELQYLLHRIGASDIVFHPRFRLLWALLEMNNRGLADSDAWARFASLDGQDSEGGGIPSLSLHTETARTFLVQLWSTYGKNLVPTTS